VDHCVILIPEDELRPTGWTHRHPAEAATQHARVTRMLQEFGAALRATAPGSSTAQTWTEHTAAWRMAA